jgi:ribosome-associated heat shock protein Hsp15
LQEGRPTKRDRREIDKVSQRGAEWGSRWSAAIDE